MPENDQATMLTQYCGQLNSPLSGKWTLSYQRGPFSYYVGEEATRCK